MFGFLITALLNGLAIWLGSKYLDGVKVTDFSRAIIIGLVVALLNATLGKILHFVPSPERLVSFGLFNLVIDALLLKVADYFLKGLEIKNFWWALALAFLLSIVNGLAHWIF